MTVIAGVDVGNATTEVVIVADGAILGAGRAPTRGRKGSPESLRGAAAVVRRVARQTGAVVDEARIAPLRPVETSVRTVPDVPPPTGRLRVLRAGVATPGGAGACVGVPLLLGNPAGTADHVGPVIVVVPPQTRFDQAAAGIRGLLAAGTRVGAVLVGCDEAVLVANRLPAAKRPRSGHRPGGLSRRGVLHAARGRGTPARSLPDDAGRSGGTGRGVRLGRARRW